MDITVKTSYDFHVKKVTFQHPASVTLATFLFIFMKTDN